MKTYKYLLNAIFGMMLLLTIFVTDRANAQNFTNYTSANTSTLCNNHVNSIKIDAQGIKWFGTENGISRFNGSAWTTYTTKDGLADNGITAIAIDGQGNKWFGTYKGVSKFDGTTWTNYTTADGLAGNSVSAISIDMEGNIWFGTQGKGVSMFDGTTWTTYTMEDGLASNFVNAIAIDSQGIIWFGTSDFEGLKTGGVSRYDGTTWATYNSSNGLANNIVRSIAVDAQGNKWFATTNNSGSAAVSKFDGNSWTTYTKAEGLADNEIRTIVIDAQSNIWFGTAETGVSKFDGTTWQNFGLEGNEVKAIAIDAQDNKWFGTNGAGVWRLDGTTSTYTDIVPVGSILKKLSSNQFAFARGAVWYNDSILLFTDDFLSGTDIYQFDPISKQISKWPSNSPHCSGLSLDQKGNLIGASSNVIMINKAGEVIKTLASKYNGKPFDNPIDLIADNKGGVYFCDPDFFLTTFPQDKTAVYYIDSIGNVKRVIDDLAEPNGPVLSPDGTKLYVLDSDNKYVYSWDVAPDGSVSGKLNLAELQTTGGVSAGAIGMAIDIYGNIYVGTEMGIQVFTPQGVAITTIEVPEHAVDCDFGGKDFKTLYITAVTNLNSNLSSNLYSIDLNYPGYAVSRKNITGVFNSISNQPLVEVYPNPVSDILFVKHNLGKANSIDLLSIDGKKETIQFNKQEDSGFELNTQSLKAGLYLLRIVSNEGMVTRKFVKH